MVIGQRVVLALVIIIPANIIAATLDMKQTQNMYIYKCMRWNLQQKRLTVKWIGFKGGLNKMNITERFKLNISQSV